MPELPDVVVYIDCLTKCVASFELQRIHLASSFVLPSVTPPLEAVEGRPVTSLRRLGKRIVFVLADQPFIVLHLMIAGRLCWRPLDDAIPKKRGLAAFDFPNGSLLLTEAGSTKRASIHLVRGETALEAHDRAGLEILDTDLAAFRTALLRENRTLKLALTDPQLFSGGRNAVLRRDSASGVSVTIEADAAPRGRRGGPPARLPLNTLAGWVEHFTLTLVTASRRRSRRFGRVWRSTAAISSHVRPAAHPCSGSCTRVPRSTTAKPVRPTAGSWLTGRCRSYSRATGHGHSRSERSVDSPELWR